VGGDGNINQDPLPIILGSWQHSIASDTNGLASIQPSDGGFGGALAILGNATAGAGSVTFGLQSLWPVTN